MAHPTPRQTNPHTLLFLLFSGILVVSGIALVTKSHLSLSSRNASQTQPTPRQSPYLPTSYSPQELLELVKNSDKYVIVDVRDKREYDRGHIPGAVHADYHDETALVAAAKNAEGKIPVAYCTYSAWRGPYAAYTLYKNGFTNVGILNGGINAWKEKTGLLAAEDGETPFVYPHPEKDVIFPPRALAITKEFTDVVAFTITAKRFSFSPSQLVVKQGQKVILTITATDIAHGFALPEFGIAEELLPNQPKRIEFIADKKGVFPFVCSVYCGQDTSGHSHYSMTGELIVQ